MLTLSESRGSTYIGATLRIKSVVVIGTGLIGTSIALDLRRNAVQVRLDDVSSASLNAAVLRGAGEPHKSGDRYDVAIVAVPPQSVLPTVQRALGEDIADLVIDVASTKRDIAIGAAQAGIDPSRFVPSHPMAGREVTGPEAALQDLFQGKAWAITPLEDAASQSVARVKQLVRLCGAIPLCMSPNQHDTSVAIVSHMPHVVSSALAGSLISQEGALPLSGTGLPGMVRLAGGSPDLWAEILRGNAENTADALREVCRELDSFVRSLDAVAAGEDGAHDTLLGQLRKGQRGNTAVGDATDRR